MADTTRQLLADVLERVSSNPAEWTDRDTETITRLRAAAEWEVASEKVATARIGATA
ncbi:MULTISPECIES: hypothetical protein [Actinomycetes]|uniref:Uncharacterized protein n=1 Tax=Streptomyces acidiscabies TaxID=42234 RepID=A0ABU4MB46_9ACTN|nr:MULTISPECIES: hypothetical protein [Actinomycetes]MDX2974019.1 hypothetical protein [Kribbella solani]MDX3025340.1 hypothetical protein [Streptomyces acidiscabies]